MKKCINVNIAVYTLPKGMREEWGNDTPCNYGKSEIWWPKWGEDVVG